MQPRSSDPGGLTFAECSFFAGTLENEDPRSLQFASLNLIWQIKKDTTRAAGVFTSDSRSRI
jgi:hypothetical protein